MENVTKTCQNCKNDFTIESDDFLFYEKIKVPPPTFCPECRLQRRLALRNERNLYKATCDLCKKSIISIVPNGEFKTYCNSCWISDNWNVMSYGVDYDFSCSFFEQYKKLLHKVPVRALSGSSSSLINSEYTNTSSNLKDCYLVYGSEKCENCLYCSEIIDSFDCIDCMMVTNSNFCYGSVNCHNCSRVHYSVDCKDSFNIKYSRNLSGCSYCFGCSNLTNKSYYIFNELYNKDEYILKISELETGSFLQTLTNGIKSKDFQNKFPRKFYHGFKNYNVSGDYIFNSKNTNNSFIVTGAEDCKYCFNLVVNSSKGCFDYSDWGANVENVYESQTCGNNISDLKFSFFVGKNSMNVEYSGHCANCQNIFGCLGLRNKQYCIFNKQYTKEEYFNLKKEIIKHMNEIPYVDKTNCIYKYGEFFPIEISVFPYNNTTAQDYFNLSREEIIQKGYKWSDNIDRNFAIDMKASELVDNINDVSLDITNKTIQCLNINDKDKHPNCTGAFKVISRELSFYKREKIPLPRFCPNCRHYERFKHRNSTKLWHGKCMKEGCSNEFETSYSPERPEIVYCEKCYQQEVY
ncbi:MAG: hypothetical protein WCT42_03465 [Candidatus Paceibacterota bacterium]